MTFLSPLADELSAVHVMGADPGPPRQAELAVSNFGDAGVDLDHVHTDVGQRVIHPSGERVAAAADDQDLGRPATSEVARDLPLHFFVWVAEPGWVVRTNVRMDQAV